jgi:sugar-phosphatase
MIKLDEFDAVIYDMDGVIIDSEPFWKSTQIDVFNELGLDFMKIGGEKTVGLRIDEVIEYWFERHPWTKLSTSEVVRKIMSEVIRRVKEEGESKPGVIETLTFFKKHRKKIALASSSYHNLIDAVLIRLGIRDYFEVINSAEDLKYGKPHPEIYINTANSLGINPTRCLVIEDSINGIISGKAAKMQVVAIPDLSHTPDDRIILADQIEDSLLTLMRKLKS